MNFSTLAFLGLVGVSQQAGGVFDYKKNGEDWGDIEGSELCADGTTQSPIDLSTKLGAYPELKYEDDLFSRIYFNQKTVKSYLNGQTMQVDLMDAVGSGFQSNIGADNFGAPEIFKAAQFHFHAGSEHFFDGKQFDLEMHTVHLPAANENGFFAAAFGIIFDTSASTIDLSADEIKIIDDFFDALQWDGSDPVVDELNYGELMRMVDPSNRFVYKGSLTTPPCTETIYWNLMRDVYPIKQKHVDQFKAQLDRAAGYDASDPLSTYGNWRVPQPIISQDVHVVQKITVEEKGAILALMVVFLVCFLGTFGGCLYYMKKAGAAEAAEDKKEAPASVATGGEQEMAKAQGE